MNEPQIGTNNKRKMKLPLVILAALVLLSLGALVSCQMIGGDTEEEATESDISVLLTPFADNIVGISGNIESYRTVSLTWNTDGVVESVNVGVGETVSEGDVLASLDEDSLNTDVAIAQSSPLEAKDNLAELEEGYDPLTIANAQVDMLTAQEALEDAQFNVSRLVTPTKQYAMDTALDKLTLAEEDYARAILKYNKWLTYRYDDREDLIARAVEKDEDTQMQNLEKRMNSAKESYWSALYAYNNLVGEPAPDTLEMASADYKTLDPVPSEADKLQAQSALKAAQAELDEKLAVYEDLLAGPSSDELEGARAEVYAQEKLLESKTLTAPFDGVVTEIEVAEGDSVDEGDYALRIDDMSKLIISASVPEIDLEVLEIGQDVNIYLDALPDETFSGRLTYIGDSGTSNGVVYFPLEITLLINDPRILPGMTATADIITAETE